jgi:RNA polymerase sigma-70 factor (ECF subfamily)
MATGVQPCALLPVREAPLPEPSVAPAVDWGDLVERIRCGSPEAMAELYRLFSRGVRFYLCRQLGAQDLDDKVHDTFVIVVQAIQRGELREADRLMGFVRTVVRRQVASYIERAVQSRKEVVDLEQGFLVSDHRRGPEEALADSQMEEIAEQVLRSISDRDREILTRFYLLEQSQDEICKEMGLSDTQFRLLKSRAKARFGALGKKKMLRSKFW